MLAQTETLIGVLVCSYKAKKETVEILHGKLHFLRRGYLITPALRTNGVESN